MTLLLLWLACEFNSRGAQEELEKATGYRDQFGRLNEAE